MVLRSISWCFKNLENRKTDDVVSDGTTANISHRKCASCLSEEWIATNKGGGMPFTSRELRAINSYCVRYDCAPSLAAGKKIFFVHKESQKQESMTMQEVLDIYDENRREDARERARQKRAALTS